jgi:hypothetical protein
VCVSHGKRTAGARDSGTRTVGNCDQSGSGAAEDSGVRDSGTLTVGNCDQSRQAADQRRAEECGTVGPASWATVTSQASEQLRGLVVTTFGIRVEDLMS